ncbi:RAMP superfamily CRISPR-associated protein [Buchananella hordeovulneris]|uniref:CRISPR type III-associated protein domain-containing protein n=1 Tax=Buchananella hordeovulneris TaxID=52770 RepID=A0A1Q5PUQ1_9ACTO|nr:RAMP superfamily CRISPR-associated protein [Buchananella hordeovulneris]OKL51298.1 hypothetical protein BSZ40_08295 [Buchananella hordeovulneris]
MSVNRYELEIRLRTTSPLHSGGVDEVADRSQKERKRAGELAEVECTPRRFARDGAGRAVLTGRSIKGALRAACAQLFPEAEKMRERVFGKESQQGHGQGGDAGWGALLQFHPILLGETQTETDLMLRTGIAVDRHWGAVADGALFQHEVLPTNRELTLRITAEVGASSTAQDEHKVAAAGFRERRGRDQTLEDYLAHARGKFDPDLLDDVAVQFTFAQIIAALATERVAFGGRKGAGWGRVELAEPGSWKCTRVDVASLHGLQALLRGEPEAVELQVPQDTAGLQPLRFKIAWHSPTGILVAATPPKASADSTPPPTEKDAVPTEPLLAWQTSSRQSGESNQDAAKPAPLVLPGSSVRGALRSRASRIARTILAARESLEHPDWSATDVHTQLRQDAPLVRDLFGDTTRRGAVTVLETLANPVSRERWVTVSHNAGDRWTGGVAIGAFYKETYPLPQWNDIVIEVDPLRLPAGTLPDENSAWTDRRRAALCLLGLVLAELATGSLPLGSRVTRGLGEVEVKAVTLENWPSGESLLGGSRLEIAQKLLKCLQGLEVVGRPDVQEVAGWASYLWPERRTGDA